MGALASAAGSLAPDLPLDGLTVGLCLQVTAETSVLATSLMRLGARIVMCAGNPHTTQDDVAAYLASRGAEIHAWRGQSRAEFASSIRRVLDAAPDIIADDGAELCTLSHADPAYARLRIIGGTEETTTGMRRLRAILRKGTMRYPVIAVNDARTKSTFDNAYGTGQSAVDAVLRILGVILASRIVVVAGYGPVGRGVASRFSGMGARIIVTEADPLRALEAHLDGHAVMTMARAARLGDLFITCTGQKNVITVSHMRAMRSGAVLANVGHFDVEIDVRGLCAAAGRPRQVRPGLEEFVLGAGARILVVSRGYVANLAGSSGHPPEIMSLSFANQLYCMAHIARHAGSMKPGLHGVPVSIDEQVARDALEASGVRID